MAPFFCSVNVLAEKANKVEAVRAVLLSLLKSVRTRRGKERITYLALQFSMLVVFSMFWTPPSKQSYDAVRPKYAIGNKGVWHSPQGRTHVFKAFYLNK